MLPGGRDYGGKLGVQDAADEAESCASTASPPCASSPAATGRLARRPADLRPGALVRIPAVGWFADAVGKLIQGRIQAM